MKGELICHDRKVKQWKRKLSKHNFPKKPSLNTRKTPGSGSRAQTQSNRPGGSGHLRPFNDLPAFLQGLGNSCWMKLKEQDRLFVLRRF